MTLTESLGSTSSQPTSELIQGYELLSREQTVTFTKYVRLVLPLDGFVFWVRAAALGISALNNAATFNGTPFNAAGISGAAPTITLKGSLHHSITERQLEDETISINRVLFTTVNESQDIDALAPGEMYIGEFDFQPAPPWLTSAPRKIRFAFSTQGLFYQAAALYHYQGDAIYPAMDSQIIDDPRELNTREPVISNSLPAWLLMNQLPTPVWLPPRQRFPLFPSFAVPPNLLPPYASIHIGEDDTRPIAAFPEVSQNWSTMQLAADQVTFTFYGLRNDAVQDFLIAAYDYSVTTDQFGFMSGAIPRDAKRTQVELGILAMKKRVSLQVSYFQRRINDVARQLIENATVSILSGE